MIKLLNYDIGIVIPAKGPSLSVRLPNKNALPFGDQPTLLDWKISQLVQIVPKDIIYVSTEYEPFKDIARKWGVKVHDRDPILCDEKKSTASDYITGITKDIPHENICFTYITAPLLLPTTYYNIFTIFYDECLSKNAKYDSLISVNKLQEFFRTENNSINYTFKSLVEDGWTYNLQPVYRVTCGVFVTPKNIIMQHRYQHGIQPLKYVVSLVEGVDINYPEEYEIAKALYPLYLKQNNDNL